MSLIIHVHIFILCDIYPAWEIDKDMVNISMTNMQCSLLIIYCKFVPGGKNINSDTWMTPG